VHQKVSGRRSCGELWAALHERSTKLGDFCLLRLYDLIALRRLSDVQIVNFRVPASRAKHRQSVSSRKVHVPTQDTHGEREAALYDAVTRDVELVKQPALLVLHALCKVEHR
jgi:hypothetical protein